MKRTRLPQQEEYQQPAGKRQTTGQRPPPAPGSAQGQGKLTTGDALNYLREVKVRFVDRKEVYETFLEIMKEFKAQRIDTSGVITRVKQLFKGHRELILGFNTFLPRGYEIELARVSDEEEEEEETNKQPVEFDQAISYVNKIKTRFSNDERVYKAFLEILNMYRKGQKTISNVYEEVAILFSSHQDLLDEFTYFLPDNNGPLPANMRGASMRMGMAGRGRGDKAAGGSMAAGTDHSRLMHKRKAARKAEEGFRRMDEEDPYAAARRGQLPLTRELQFLERVKARLRSRESYSDFLKCLNLYAQDIISRQELVQLVSDIFGRAPDLVSQFHSFVNNCEVMDMGELAQAGNLGRPGMPPMSNRDMLKAKLQKDKFMTKPLSEIVASETERITPSYVKIPPGYPRLKSTGRTQIGEEVLNDQYVNVITGSEDYSFKLMRKNQYEEALFRCEDDRYEFEMCIEQNRSAMRALRPMVEKLTLMSPEERANLRLDDVPRFNSMHTGHIQRLYSEQGPVLVDLLRKNPAVAIPVVFHRMEQKDAEWQRVKAEMTKIWRKVYEQNYPRSLDHRSFYFKQQEKKNLMGKTMVSEIKDAADRRRADEQHLKCLSMAHRYSTPAAGIPGHKDLAYQYADKSVFGDVFTVLRTAIDHHVQASARDQVLLLYLEAVEPFFGLKERSEELTRLKAKAEENSGAVGDTEMPDANESSDMEAEAGGAANNGATPEGTPDIRQQDLKADPSDADGMKGASASGRPGSNGGGEQGSGVPPATSYRGCKPVMPWSGADGRPDSQRHYVPPPSTRLLFGNEHVYVFFRYHRYLYDRLCAARRFCLDVATKRATLPSHRTGGFVKDDSKQEAVPEEVIKEEAERIHTSFLSLVNKLLSNSGMDVGAFEDQVRALLGTNSYELFTMDKLCSKLVKHMQLMVQDDQTAKLWEMYSYEQLRGKRIAASVYHINCHTILDDTCYRIEFSDENSTLQFLMNDPDKYDVYLAPEGILTPYIKAYISGVPTPGAQLPQVMDGNETVSPLFLRRSFPAPRPAHNCQPPDEQLAEALKAVVVMNRLECKVACTSCKVSYVLDTEDVMLRKKTQRPSEPQVEARRRKQSERFNHWLDTAKNAANQRQGEEEEAAQILAATTAQPAAVAEAAAAAVAAPQGALGSVAGVGADGAMHPGAVNDNGGGAAAAAAEATLAAAAAAARITGAAHNGVGAAGGSSGNTV
uniref:Histone deacetylase interacting domain-containing protein n=1 Tax=Dunaliella tertiolecta TaxID=3047 RepID=A0A7S3QMC6_DUNTE|mmetsp:Transcript_19850/g.51620  ORF Transcript_19850/g.51620 Transcript_19850/m.51620 type:complete len:1213 (+) Transcript_19850:201-3839(+)